MTAHFAISRRRALAGGAALTLVGCSGRSAAASGPRTDLYTCEGCEAAMERDPAALTSHADIAGPQERGERLVVRGTVYLLDGTTPAPGVVIYAHQTDADGYYRGGQANAPGSARHGAIKGWLKTDAQGRYRFDTIKPAPYPSRTLPAHIHLYLAEPGRRPYYVDDVVFAGEFLVDARYRAAQELRGGSGIVALTRENGMLLAVRDIVLEKHPA